MSLNVHSFCVSGKRIRDTNIKYEAKKGRIILFIYFILSICQQRQVTRQQNIKSPTRCIWQDFVDDIDRFLKFVNLLKFFSLVQMIWWNLAKPAGKIIRENRDDLNRRASKSWQIWQNDEFGITNKWGKTSPRLLTK